MSGDSELSQEQIDEIERWEKAFANIPFDLQHTYAPLLSHMPLIMRITVLKILDSMVWEKLFCQRVLTALTTVPCTVIDNLVTIMTNLDLIQLDPFLNIFNRLNNELALELVGRTPMADIIKLVDVARYLENTELCTMLELMSELSIAEVLGILDRYNEPMAKHCRLCRTKRVYALEFRMLQNDMPSNIAAVPGNIAIVDRADISTSDDESGFSFDLNSSTVYWMKHAVDMMGICDKCLADVQRAACSVTRFDEIHHIDANLRRQEMRQLKEGESQRADLISKLSIERVRRRAREFALRALQSQRIGEINIKREEERLMKQKQEEYNQMMENNRKIALLNAAHAVDKKWKKYQIRCNAPYLQQVVDNADMSGHLKFDRSHPVPKAREHPYSWRLAQFDETGLPIEESAAAEYFGRDTKVVLPDLELLKHWKEESMEIENELETLRKEEERLKREQRREAQQELRQTLIELDIVAQRREHLRLRAAEIAERERVEKRRMDREARRHARIAEAECRSREEMAIEDEFSAKYRFYLWEQHRIQCELKEMAAAEAEQTKIDRFWGIPTYLRWLKEEEARRKREYDLKVANLREICIHVRVTRPFADEVGKFRERDTNKIIR